VAGRAGDRLRQLRSRLGLTTREVAELSRKIADAEENEEFALSHARLIQIENNESTPSIYKLYTLSVVYCRPFTEMVSLYLDLDKIPKYQMDLPGASTRELGFDVYDENGTIEFPIRFDPGFQLKETNLVSRMVELWGEVPVAVLRALNVRKHRYGFIGLEDFTMYPLLRPGSFVQIDDQQKPQAQVMYPSEYDRPIWFLELRDRYICSWCELRRDRIISIPHPLSGARTQEFAYPNEAEIVGRVIAVAVRLVSSADRSLHPVSKLQGRS